MAVQDRVFTSEFYTLALYKDANDPSSLHSSGSDLLQNLLYIFTEWRLLTRMAKLEWEGTSDAYGYRRAYRMRHKIEVNAIVDTQQLTIMDLVLNNGAGPFWMWFWPCNRGTGNALTSYLARVELDDKSFDAGSGPVIERAIFDVLGNIRSGTIPT